MGRRVPVVLLCPATCAERQVQVSSNPLFFDLHKHEENVLLLFRFSLSRANSGWKSVLTACGAHVFRSAVCLPGYRSQTGLAACEACPTKSVGTAITVLLVLVVIVIVLAVYYVVRFRVGLLERIVRA